MKSDTFKGYFFALAATLAYSNVYIFSKAAMNEISRVNQLSDAGPHASGAIGELILFGFYWFLFAFILNTIWSAISGKLKQVKALDRSQIRILVLLGVLEILTNTSFYLSIQIIPDPSVTSFLGNLYPVFLTLGGVVVLKERFTLIEMTGVFLALAGAFIVSLNKGEFTSTLKNMFIPGTLVVVVNAILASTTSIVGKINIRKLTPELITLNHTFWLLLYALILMLFLREPWTIPAKAFTNIALGAFLGPFMGVLMIYYSFKFIEASRSSIIQSLKGIFVLLGAWLYLGTLPLKHQLTGGLLTVLGVLVMSLSQSGLFGKMWQPGKLSGVSGEVPEKKAFDSGNP